MKNKNILDYYKIDCFFLILFFILPSLLYSYGYVNSLSAFTIVLQFCYLFIYTFIRNKKFPINIKFLSATILIGLIIFSHQIFIIFLSDFSFGFQSIMNVKKISFSYLSILIFFYSVFFLNEFFFKIKNSEIYFYKLIKSLFLIMPLLSLFILIRFNKFSPYYIHGGNDLPMFLSFFSEPSHFILNFFSIFFFFIILNPKYRIICLAIGLLLSIGYPSLTLLFGIFLIIIILFSILNLFLLVAITFTFFFFLSYLNIDFQLINYFTNRLDILKILNNCSAYFVLNNNDINFNELFFENNCSLNNSLLYYLKSGHEMYLNLVNYPFGIGFQNLGTIGMESLFRKLAFLQSGSFKTDISLNSAFLLSKLISEFGIFGLLFLIYYLKIFLKSFIFFKFEANLLLIKKKYLEIFYHISILSFSIELFIRGFGYFSIGTFLFILSIMGLYYKNNNEN
jgi:hypothetical protein